MITSPAAGGPGSTPEESLADTITRVVLAVDGVVGLHGGMFGEAATYLPGRRVTGVRTSDEGTDVHLSVVYGSDVREVAHRVQLALVGVAPAPVRVTVEDVVPVDTVPVDTVPVNTAPVAGRP